MEKNWTREEIKAYYAGIRYSDYPLVFWQRILPYLEECSSLSDIGCGPGAFCLQALEAGLRVQAIDINYKNLQALEEQVAKRGKTRNCRFLYGDWLEVPALKTDVSVCAYSLGGNIGTSAGLKKILDITERVAFLIIPYDGHHADFRSEELYEKFGIKLPEFQSSYKKYIQMLQQWELKIKYESVEYDFGVPFVKENLGDYAIFLQEKLGLPGRKDVIASITTHINKWAMEKNGRPWLPNPKKGVMITCWKEV